MKIKTILLYFALRLSITFLIFSILVRWAYAVEVYELQGNITWQHALEIRELTDNSTLVLNSAGGNSLYMQDIIKSVRNKNLNVICKDYCASAAALIYLSSNKHEGQKTATLAFHAPGHNLGNGQRIGNFSPQYKEFYRSLGVDKLMTKYQWDTMWKDAQAIVEIRI
jgi:ATP-dependent protease ClpP protease subunit